MKLYSAKTFAIYLLPQVFATLSNQEQTLLLSRVCSVQLSHVVSRRKQRGQAVRALDLQLGGPEFKFFPDC